MTSTEKCPKCECDLAKERARLERAERRELRQVVLDRLAIRGGWYQMTKAGVLGQQITKLRNEPERMRLRSLRRMAEIARQTWPEKS